MKKLCILFITYSIVFTACSKDDDANISSNILGTWKAVSIDYLTKEHRKIKDKITTTWGAGHAFDMDHSLIFEEDPNHIESIGTYSIDLSKAVGSENEKSRLEHLKIVDNGTWVGYKSELKTTHDDQDISMKILELTNSKLVLEKVEEEWFDLGAAELRNITTIVVTFEKQ